MVPIIGAVEIRNHEECMPLHLAAGMGGGSEPGSSHIIVAVWREREEDWVSGSDATVAICCVLAWKSD